MDIGTLKDTSKLLEHLNKQELKGIIIGMMMGKAQDNVGDC